MFKKKTKLTIEITDEGIKPSHNITEQVSEKVLEELLTILVNGDLGNYLLQDLMKNPALKDFCKELLVKLYPIPYKPAVPIIKPSQVIPNYLNQIKSIISE